MFSAKSAVMLISHVYSYTYAYIAFSFHAIHTNIIVCEGLGLKKYVKKRNIKQLHTCMTIVIYTQPT